MGVHYHHFDDSPKEGSGNQLSTVSMYRCDREHCYDETFFVFSRYDMNVIARTAMNNVAAAIRGEIR